MKKPYTNMFKLSFISYTLAIAASSFVIASNVKNLAMLFFFFCVLYQFSYLFHFRNQEEVSIPKALLCFFFYAISSVSIYLLFTCAGLFLQDAYLGLHLIIFWPLFLANLILLIVYFRKDIKNFFIFLGVLVSIAVVLVIIKNVRLDYLTNYNKEYVSKYIEENLSDCEILHTKETVYTSGIFGSHETVVDSDQVYQSYTKVITVLDHQLNTTYPITFSHFGNEKISVTGNTREHYLDNSKKYENNFKLIQEIIESYGGKVTNLGTYSEENVGQYILLLYLPDANTTKVAINDLQDNLYSNIANQKNLSEQNITISMPRYIICNNENTYNKMVQNLDSISPLLIGRNYSPKGSVNLQDVCNQLLKKQVSNYSVSMEKQNISSFQEKDHEWICLYELENISQYAMTIYEKK